jgi:AcrR family transcriptional regulator
MTFETRTQPHESRTIDSRDEILKAAMRLFAQRGYHETSMSEVAREARVSKALIFWHFKTKEELFMAVLNRQLEPYFIDFNEEAGKLDERTQVERLVEAYLAFVRENAASVRFFISQLLHSESPPDNLGGQVLKPYEGYRDLLVDLLRRAQAKGLCASGFAPELVASLLLATLNGFLVGYLFLGGPPIELRGAVAMLAKCLLGEGAHSPAGEGQAVA